MKLKNRFYSTLLAIFAVAAMAIAQNASAGSSAYSSQAVTPTIYAKNYWYNVAYPVVGTPPSNSYITNVYFTWAYSSYPAGLTVYLCDNNAAIVCFDVTNVRSGSANFTGYNVSATTPLRLFAQVAGTGTMAPLAGSTTTVSVNYSW
ncbi:MAG TPA: flagellar protein FlhE [Noviherbaspirillum sp.]